MLARPGLLLRVEGLALFALSIFLYHSVGEGWKAFLVLFLLPDIGMLGYLAGPRIGAACYNVLHAEFFPVALAGAALIRHWPSWLSFALVWLAHIGFDRMLGYGLKYPTAFKETHLQRVN